MADPTYGWVTIAEADAYMVLRLGASEVWSSGAEKVAALYTAYLDLSNCNRFSLPAVADANMKMAQYEQALFRLRQDDGLDTRIDLRTMGVVMAGVVKETYRGHPTLAAGRRSTVEVPMAEAMLSGHAISSSAFIVELERDEDEGTTI